MDSHDLARRLLEEPNCKIMILDGFNGGGYPRDLNLGPRVGAITSLDAAEVADCEGRVGEQVILIGYGCY